MPARSGLCHPGQSRPGLERHRPEERGAERRKRKWVVGRDGAEGRSGFLRERRRADGEVREPSRGPRAGGGVWRPRAAAAASGETALGAVARAAQVGSHRPETCARASPLARPGALPYPAVGAREGVSGVTLCTSRAPSLPSWTRSERWPTWGCRSASHPSVVWEPGAGTASGGTTAARVVCKVPFSRPTFGLSDSAYAGRGMRLTPVFSFLAKRRRK